MGFLYGRLGRRPESADPKIPFLMLCVNFAALFAKLVPADFCATHLACVLPMAAGTPVN